MSGPCDLHLRSLLSTCTLAVGQDGRVTRLFSRRKGGRRQSSPDRDTIGPPRDIPLVQVTHTDSSFASRCAKSCHLGTTEFHAGQCCSHASQLAPSNMGVVCGLGKRVRQSIRCVRLGMRLGVNIPPHSCMERQRNRTSCGILCCAVPFAF